MSVKRSSSSTNARLAAAKNGVSRRDMAGIPPARGSSWPRFSFWVCFIHWVRGAFLGSIGVHCWTRIASRESARSSQHSAKDREIGRCGPIESNGEEICTVILPSLSNGACGRHSHSRGAARCHFRRFGHWSVGRGGPRRSTAVAGGHDTDASTRLHGHGANVPPAACGVRARRCADETRRWDLSTGLAVSPELPYAYFCDIGDRMRATDSLRVTSITISSDKSVSIL